MLPSDPEHHQYVETLSQGFGGLESKETLRDMFFKFNVNLDDQNTIVNINIELEHSNQYGYDLINRAWVYACQNLLATTVNNNYDNIHRTYSIWICMENHISSVEGIKDKKSPTSFVHSYCIGKQDVVNNTLEYNKRADKINLVFIELGEIIKHSDKFTNTNNYYLITKYIKNLFKEQTKRELDSTIKDLSSEFKGKELEYEGADTMTSRIYSMKELEYEKNILVVFNKLTRKENLSDEQAVQQMSECFNKSIQEIEGILFPN